MRIRLLALIFATALCGFVGSAEGRIRTVPGDHGTISDALAAAQANDTVMVGAGRWQTIENCATIFRSAITLMSLEGPTETIIDADQLQRGEGQDSIGFALVTGCKVQGFTFTNFVTSPIAAVNANNIRVYDCIFERNVQRSLRCSSGIRIEASTGAIIQHCIWRNNASGMGGGGVLFLSQANNGKVWDCIFIENETTKFGGGVSVTASTGAIIGNCLFTGCFAQVDGGAVAFTQSGSGTVQNCTFVNNSSRAQEGYGGGIYIGVGATPIIINNILWGNAAANGNQIGKQEQGGQYTISNNCIEGGADGIYQAQGQNTIEDAPELTNGREPLWGINNYYLDPEDSPCVDAGSVQAAAAGMDTMFTSPELELDRDVVDLGFHYDLDSYLRIGTLTGTVISALTGEGIGNVVVETSRRVRTFTSESGAWRIDGHNFGDIWIKFHHDAYIDTTVFDLFLEEDGVLDTDIEMLHAVFLPSVDAFVMTVDSGTVHEEQFTITNEGSGVLTYRGTPKLTGDADREPWVIRNSLSVGATAADDRIHGAVLVDSIFYVSGANGNDTNLIYTFDKEGALLDSFPQMGTARYGFKSLAYDGNLIWGSGEDNVYGFDLQGNLGGQFEAPLNPVENITYDPTRGVFWVSGITTDIIAVNPDGSQAGIRITNRDYGLRKYGLFYWPNDPDGHPLYVLYRPSDGPVRNLLMKFDPDNIPDTMSAAELFTEGNVPLQGANIATWDLFSMVVFSVANNPPATGGDRIDIFQLAGNTSWMILNPISGEVMPQDMQAFTLGIDMAGFPIGRYEGQLYFTHNAWGNEFWFPIVVNLRRPVVGVDEPEPALPLSTEIKAIHPNPFNGMTTLSYSIASNGLAKMTVYDLAGREVGQPINGLVKAGNHSITIDANNWPTGVYIAKLEAAGTVKTSKLILMR